MAINTTPIQQIPKPPKKGSSKSGAVLSILALMFAAIGSALIKSKYQGEGVTNTADKAGEAVASGAWAALSTILGMPLILAGMGLAVIAIVLTVIKLRKVKARSWFTSAIWILISIWSLSLAINAFSLVAN